MLNWITNGHTVSRPAFSTTQDWVAYTTAGSLHVLLSLRRAVSLRPRPPAPCCFILSMRRAVSFQRCYHVLSISIVYQPFIRISYMIASLAAHERRMHRQRRCKLPRKLPRATHGINGVSRLMSCYKIVCPDVLANNSSCQTGHLSLISRRQNLYRQILTSLNKGYEARI